MRRKSDLSPGAAKAILVIFIIVGAILILVAGLALLGSTADKRRCTEPVRAVVVDMVQRSSHRSGRRHHRTSITYAPVYEYEYGGRIYRYTSKVSTYPPRYEVGQIADIKVDPTDPSRVYDNNNATVFIIVIAAAIGGIFLLVGILIFVAINKTRGTPPKDMMPPTYPPNNNYYQQ